MAAKQAPLTVSWAGGNSADLQQYQPERDRSAAYYEEFKDVRVTVAKTRDLVDEAIAVTVTGMPGATQSIATGAGTFSMGGNFVHAMQCWGDPTDQEFYKNCLYGAWSVASTSTPGRPDVVLSVTLRGGSSEHNVPFRDVVGREYSSTLDSSRDRGFELSQVVRPDTANERAEFVDGSGTAQFLFETQSAASQPYLGCGDEATGGLRCWLVIVPRGLHASTASDECIIRSYPHNVDKLQQNSPVNPHCDYWANRLVVPLDFRTTGSACPPGSVERLVVGSEAVSTAFASWQAGLCQSIGSAYAFTSASDVAVRGQLLSGQTHMAITARPLTEQYLLDGSGADQLAQADLVYAPVAISGAEYDSGGFTAFSPGSSGSSRVLVREQWVTIPVYVYDYSKNLADGGPRRDLTFEVVAYTLVGHSANPATLTASNPAPATPQGITVEAGPGQIGVAAQRPTDPDLVGMLVWMGTAANFVPSNANLIYDGSDNAYMKTGLAPGVTMYFKLAFYDRFGKTGISISTSVAGTPHATGGLLVVEELPDSPADVGGEMAVFLNVDDPDARGLWGWNGETWIFTHDGANLVANSVTAAQISVEELSAISGNLGTITAGNFTLDATGFIKGGAMSWSAGKGFWQGYDNGQYKWRVGTPGAAGAAWDGTNFTIYAPDGSITLQSGSPVSGSGYGSWSDLVTALGPISAANIGTIIPTAAIGAAQIGSIALVGTGNFSVKSANSGERMEMTGQFIRTYDPNNVMRVEMGLLI
ncbi:MAG: hypothetical protein LBG11_02295 [Bifidobacteriaceae bacterium]|nr:hypothetical protein [Bifidobacteriaceae bacterium]